MTPASRAAVPIAMLAFAAAAVLGVLWRPVMPIDETRYLAVAWEMRQGGDWFVPHLNGEIYTHKPPLLFWLINLTWSIFGVGGAGRLIGPLFGALAIWATARLAAALWPDQPGIGGRAALILAGFGVFTLFAGLTMFDAMLTLAVVLGALALVVTARTPRAWLGFGAALALGAFAKGPVILIHLLPMALLTPWWAGARIGATLRGLGIALVFGLAIVALWLVPAILIGGPDYRDAVLWSQSAGRISNSFAHQQPWWFFLAMLPLLLWPWAWSAQVWRGLLSARGSERGLRLCLVWAGATLALFSLISGKQTHYLLPALPAAALVIARTLGDRRARAPLAGLLPALLGLALILSALGAVPLDDRVAALLQPAWAICAIGAALVALGASAVWLRGPAIATLGIAAPPILALVFAAGAAGPAYDAGPIGRVFARHEADGAAVLSRDYQGEFTYAGRLTRPVLTFADPDEAEAWLAENPGRALLGRLGRPGPDWPPVETFVFRNRPYAIWTGAGATASRDGDPAT